MDDLDKTIIRMSYKARKEILTDLLKKTRRKKIREKLKKMLNDLPQNI